MATALSTFLAQVEILIGPDDANLELDDSELNTLIKAAVERYSKDTPNDVTEDVTGDGGRYYDINTELASWVEGFSHIVEIEYPAEDIADDTVPQYLDDEDWHDDYFSGGTRFLFLPNHSPDGTETLRIKYTAPYTFSGSPEEVDTPTQDFYAICNLAACLACQAISAKYSRTSDSTIAADSASHTSRASEFARRSKEYCAFYEEHLGLGEDPDFQQAAGDFVDLDTAPSWPTGRRFLYHGPETR